MRASPRCAPLLCVALAALVLFGCDGIDRREPEGFVDGVYVPRSRPTTTEHRPVERPGVRELAPGRYDVLIHAYNWGLNPDEIRIPRGAEVTFRALSLENNHGFTIADTDVNLSLWRNREARASHTFTEAREYLFMCSEYCGGGHSSMMGRLIVE